MVLAVETSDLRKHYTDVEALRGVDIRIEEGEFFGLLGPNGAGKTTLINILTGLVEKTAGDVSVFGYDVDEEYREVRDLIGVSPQEFNVDRFFPLKQVLINKAGYHGIPRKEAAERADDALDTVGLSEKSDTRFDWLSGGMKRRFLLARAMITAPELLILDEPTAGVDVQLRHDLWEIIEEMNQDGVTVLLTTHYIEEAERLCDRVTILNQGDVVQDATPNELMAAGTDTISLVLEEELEDPPELGGSARAVSIEDGVLKITVENAGKETPDILDAIREHGYNIVNFDIERASLEDVFIKLTGEDSDI